VQATGAAYSKMMLKIVSLTSALVLAPRVRATASL
jgi:hypothetical protein